MKNMLETVVLILLIIMSSTTAEAKINHPNVTVSAENLKSTVEFLTSIRPYRNHRNIKSLDAAAEYILQKFTSYGVKTEVQVFEVNGKKYKNIIGTINPEKLERIIVGAHYDVCGSQPGADDNASAVAGLLEIVRLMKGFETKVNYRIDFLAYSLEEPPNFATKNMGSYVHAKSLHDNKVNVKGMICLEMIGYFTDKKNSQRYPLGIMKWFYPSTGNFIGIVSNYKGRSLVKKVKKHMKKTAVKTESLKAPASLPGVDFSDHRNYWKFGWQAVMITDTAFYRNPNYHQASDTIDTLDFTKMKEVVKGVVWTLINF